MKKFFLSLLMCSLLLCSVSIAESIDFSGMSDEQLRGLIDEINLELAARQLANAPSSEIIAQADLEGIHLEVIGMSISHETLGDKAGTPAVVIQCRFVNTGNEDKSFAQLVSVTAFQNQIECKGGNLIEGTNGQLNTTKVQPGGSFEVPVGLLLQDDVHPVEIGFGKFGFPADLTVTFTP